MTAVATIGSVEEALRLLKAQVEKRGKEYVYKSPVGGSCVYFDPASGEPSCIVGCVLADLGVTYADITGPGPGFSDGNKVPIGRLWADGIIQAPDEVVTVLRTVQYEQDMGSRWGAAVAVAAAKAESLV